MRCAWLSAVMGWACASNAVLGCRPAEGAKQSEPRVEAKPARSAVSRAGCELLEREHRAALEAFTKPDPKEERDAGVKREHLENITGDVGRCFPAGGGAFFVGLEALRYPDDGRCLEAVLQVTYLEGATRSSFELPLPSMVGSMQCVHVDEKVSITAAVEQHSMPVLYLGWTCNTTAAATVPGPTARGWDAFGAALVVKNGEVGRATSVDLEPDGVDDIDRDGRPELFSHGDYPIPELSIRGPQIALEIEHAGASLTATSPRALAATRAGCPKTAGIVPGDLALSAHHVACARLWGADPEKLVEDIEAQGQSLCGRRRDCEAFEALVQLAERPVPLQLQ